MQEGQCDQCHPIPLVHQVLHPIKPNDVDDDLFNVFFMIYCGCLVPPHTAGTSGISFISKMMKLMAIFVC